MSTPPHHDSVTRPLQKAQYYESEFPEQECSSDGFFVARANLNPEQTEVALASRRTAPKNRGSTCHGIPFLPLLISVSVLVELERNSTSKISCTSLHPIISVLNPTLPQPSSRRSHFGPSFTWNCARLQHMSHSLNSSKGGYIGDYIGDYYRGYEGEY